MLNRNQSLVVACICFVAAHIAPAETTAAGIIPADNLSKPTLCAEEDNVHIALRAAPLQHVESFVVEARQPTYEIGVDHSEPNFTNCPTFNDPVFHFANPGTFKLFDDGTTVINAVREATFYRPQAMSVQSGGTSIDNVHYIQVYRRIAGTSSYPQVLVGYTDGNFRLKPQPEAGRNDEVFGSSIILGPAVDAARPFVDIKSIQYLPGADSFAVRYRSGGSATLALESVTRDVLRLDVSADYEAEAFARFRSMYVADANSDADHLLWHDGTGTQHNDPILNFQGGVGSDFLLTRDTRSLHNTSGPDIWVGNFTVVPEPSSFVLISCVTAWHLLRRRSH